MTITHPIASMLGVAPSEVEAYLGRLVGRCDDPPLIDQLTEADLGTPCGTASIARAALAQLRSKRPDVIRADLERELAEDDWLIRYRLRQAGLDVHQAGRDCGLGRMTSGRPRTWTDVANQTPHAELKRLRSFQDVP